MSRTNRIRRALRLYRATRRAALVALVPVLLFGDGATTPTLIALSSLFLLAACLHAAAGAWLAEARSATWGEPTEASSQYAGCLRIRAVRSDNRFPFSQSVN